MMRDEMVASSSYGSGTQSAVMPSLRVHRAQREHVGVGALVAHHADRLRTGSSTPNDCQIDS